MGGRGRCAGSASRADVAYLMRYAERLWPGVKGATLDARLEQPARDHAGSLSACARAGGDLLVSLGCNGRGVALVDRDGRSNSRAG